MIAGFLIFVFVNNSAKCKLMTVTRIQHEMPIFDQKIIEGSFPADIISPDAIADIELVRHKKKNTLYNCSLGLRLST
jgi:hypothetical protein